MWCLFVIVRLVGAFCFFCGDRLLVAGSVLRFDSGLWCVHYDCGGWFAFVGGVFCWGCRAVSLIDVLVLLWVSWTLLAW